MTFAAVATNEKVAKLIAGSEAGVMMHGPTFMGNPLACAVSVASINLLLSSPWQKRVSEIEAFMKEKLQWFAGRKGVRDVRVLGGIGVVEIENPVNLGKFQKRCVEEGVWIRPFGHNAYIMPPYLAISDTQLEFLCDKFIKILSEFL